MDNQEINFTEVEAEADLSQLLEEHDFDIPSEGDIRKGIIVSVGPKGLIVDLGLKRDGLVPAADLNALLPARRASFEVNQEVMVYIVSVEEPDNLLISVHKADLNQDWISAEELMERKEIVEVEVTQYNKGGAITTFGNLRGFIPTSHITELARGANEKMRQQKLSKMRGIMIPVKIIEVDRQRGRLVMSQKDAEVELNETRRQELMQTLQEGAIVMGKITGLRDFGAFVDIGGADGLIHISELAWHRVKHPREVVKVGDEVQVKILKIDPNEQRIALSRRLATPSPWDTVPEHYTQGKLVEGKVTRLADYGGFVELEPGVEGLLHISQLSSANIKHPNEVIREGEVHLLRVISVDTERQRIGLSLKSVTANEQMEWMASKQRMAAAKPKRRDGKSKPKGDLVSDSAGDAGADLPAEEGVGEMPASSEEVALS